MNKEIKTAKAIEKLQGKSEFISGEESMCYDCQEDSDYCCDCNEGDLYVSPDAYEKFSDKAFGYDN